jgi:hypothetical protein
MGQLGWNTKNVLDNDASIATSRGVSTVLFVYCYTGNVSDNVVVSKEEEEAVGSQTVTVLKAGHLCYVCGSCASEWMLTFYDT